MNPIHQFWAMLDRTFPAVQSCWDRDAQSLDVEQLNRFIGVASSGERHMAKFFRDVWKGTGSQDDPFDLIDAVSVVGHTQNQIIQDWIAAPFYP